MADFDPNDHTAHSTSPAATLTPQQVTQQIVDAVNDWQREGRETSILKRPDPTLAGYALVGKIGRIVATALEALTAENAKLRSDLSHNHIRANQEYDRAQKAEAEVRRLTARAATLEAEAEAAIGVLTNSLMCGFDHRRATVKELQERISGAKNILDRAVYGQPQDWYALHRRRVEAAHAAAKADHPGIDMDRLGKLCREEPDADTKREVDEMMDGIKAMDGSPSILCHPEWPTLMAEALAQVKAGD